MVFSERNCKKCNAVFLPKVHNNNFCSTKCAYKSAREKLLMDRIANPQKYVARKEKYNNKRAKLKFLSYTCNICSTKFVPTYAEQKYCSKKCYTISMKERDYKKYHNMDKEKKKEKNEMWNRWYNNKRAIKLSEKINCRICNNLFIRKYARQKICSKECKKKYYDNRYIKKVGYEPRKEIKCIICGESFIRDSIDRKYCYTRKCTLKYNRLLNYKHYKKRVGYNPKENITCYICGKKFLRTRIEQTFCNDKECKRKHIYNRNIKIFKERNGYIPHEETSCYICGKKFVRNSIKHNYCNSFECKKEHRHRIKLEWYPKNYAINKKHIRELRKLNKNYVILNILRSRIRRALKSQHTRKKVKTIDLIGCSISELKEYIQKKFDKGMTWDNYSYRGWHLDHVKPCSRFDLANEEEQRKCFHYESASGKAHQL